MVALRRDLGAYYISRIGENRCEKKHKQSMPSISFVLCASSYLSNNIRVCGEIMLKYAGYSYTKKSVENSILRFATASHIP